MEHKLLAILWFFCFELIYLMYKYINLKFGVKRDEESLAFFISACITLMIEWGVFIELFNH
jgi:uncharacterized membrane protein